MVTAAAGPMRTAAPASGIKHVLVSVATAALASRAAAQDQHFPRCSDKMIATPGFSIATPAQSDYDPCEAPTLPCNFLLQPGCPYVGGCARSTRAMSSYSAMPFPVPFVTLHNHNGEWVQPDASTNHRPSPSCMASFVPPFYTASALFPGSPTCNYPGTPTVPPRTAGAHPGSSSTSERF